MSEFRRQIAAGAVTAVVIALVLAGGTSYLFPLQPRSGAALPSTTTSTVTTASQTAISSTTYAASGDSTTEKTKTIPQSATSVTTTTVSPVTTSPPASSFGTTVTITMIEKEATATVTVGEIETTTTVVTEQIQVTNAYTISETQITLNAINVGYINETLTSISVNGEPLSSFNGGSSNPTLPVTIAPRASQTIILTFSSPLASGTYYITINTNAG